MIGIILAFITGALVILSMIINSQLAKRTGVFQGTFINYVVGLFFATILLIIKGDLGIVVTSTLMKVPLWAYLGGVLGVSVVAISNIVIPKIPAIYSTLLIFIGQLFVGILIDYFNGSLVSKGKIIGGLIVFIGLACNIIIDRMQLTEDKPII